MTRSKSSSRDDSRRNSAGRLRGALALAAVFLLAALPGAAQTLELRVSSDRDGVGARLSFRGDRTGDIVESLRSRLESRIVFTVRLYEKRTGILPPWGDRLVAEKSISRSAFWDFLEKRYVVEEDGVVQKTYATTDELLQDFLTVDALYFSEPATTGRGRYVTARARLEPVQLMPPLTLVSIVGSAAVYGTPWVRSDVP